MGFFDTEEVVHRDGARRSGLLRGSNGTSQKKNCKKARRAKLHADDSGRNWNEKASRSVSQRLGPERRTVVKDKVTASATAASGTKRLIPGVDAAAGFGFCGSCLCCGACRRLS